MVAGMKRLLAASIALIGLGSNAFAADPAPAAAPPPPAPAASNPAPAPLPAKAAAPAEPAYSWTGCYVGLSGGDNRGDSEHIAKSGAFTGNTITGNLKMPDSGIAGGSIGCDYQIEKTVMGFENSASWTGLRGSSNDVPPFDVNGVSSTRQNWIDTLTGRIGYAMDRFLIYGAAGAAFAGTDVTVTNATGTYSESQPRAGLAVGVGGEWAAWVASWGDVRFRLEYMHADFGTRQYFATPIVTATGTILTRDVKLTDDMVRAGINVRFNWGGTPIVTKY
jgi:outer membrane immunogenic protein